MPQHIFENEAAARYEAAAGADIGFVERLVWFWSNHFCISADKDIAMVGAFEREAIRAHALGNFADILIAVTPRGSTKILSAKSSSSIPSACTAAMCRPT